MGRYHNTDPVLINYLIRLGVEKRGEDYLSFPRRVLFDKIGYGPHWCHWCSKNINWNPGKRGGGGRTLVCDHIDGDIRNNDPMNLVPACQGCNAMRNRRVRDGELFIVRHSKRNRAIRRTCETCQRSFLALNAQVRIGNGRYCSHSCAARASRRNSEPAFVIRRCEQCNQSFQLQNSPARFAAGRGRFCSKSCHMKHQWAVGTFARKHP